MTSTINRPQLQPAPFGPEDTKPEKKKWSLRKKVLAVGAPAVAAASLAALLASGIGAGQNNQGPEKVDGTEQVDEPVDSPEINGTLPSELELEIPAGLNTEDLGKAFVDRLNTWMNAGSNIQEINDESLEAFSDNVPTSDFVTAKAKEFAPYFTDSLLVSDWQDRPDLVNLQDALSRLNAHNLELNLKTNSTNSDDVEPWLYTSTFEAARELSSSDGVRVVEIDIIDSNNADKNRVGEAFAQDEAVITIPKSMWTLTFTVEDGIEKISAVSATTR